MKGPADPEWAWLGRVQGIVTHVTDVKPLLTVATYLDASTGFEVYQEITGKSRSLPPHSPDIK